MPKRYEKIRDSLKQAGKGDKEAKRIAAATFNKTRKAGEKPVTGRHSKKESPRRGLGKKKPR